jgi:hypothetical protein
LGNHALSPVVSSTRGWQLEPVYQVLFVFRRLV